MITTERFEEKIGFLIRKCQCIEHDVKIMYAGMLRGEFGENLKLVVNKPLGTVLRQLEELDYSDDAPYLTREEYAFLGAMLGIRNYWVHKGYIDFLYGPVESYGERIAAQYRRLSADCESLDAAASRLEDVRIEMMAHYGRR